MNQDQDHTPKTRTWLIRGSALAAGGVVLAGVAGTAALAAGIQGSVHQSGVTGGLTGGGAGSGYSGGSTSGSTHIGGAERPSANGSHSRRARTHRANPGLSVPAPNAGPASGGSNGS